MLHWDYASSMVTFAGVTQLVPVPNLFALLHTISSFKLLTNSHLKDVEEDKLYYQINLALTATN